MTEVEWLAATDALEMLHGLDAVKPERMRLLHRYILYCLEGIGERATVTFIADVLAGNIHDLDALDQQRNALEARIRLTGGSYSLGRRPRRLAPDAQRAQAGLAALDPCDAVGEVTRWTRHALQRNQCDWLRCLFGNPFRSVLINPSWLTSTVVALADGIYADRAFDRLPILADALMDAGCANDDVLTHCRGDGPHVRGCWVVDLLTGRR